jgi:predicted RNase H-like HicB family nuclease
LLGGPLSLSIFVGLYRLWITCRFGEKMWVSGYNVEIVRLSEADGGGYLATVPDLPGCSSTGETESEAVAGIAEAIEGWIVMTLRLGQVIPSQKRSATNRASDKVHAA